MVQWYEVGTKTINVQLEELQPVVNVSVEAAAGKIKVLWSAGNPGHDDATITFVTYVDGTQKARDVKTIPPGGLMNVPQEIAATPGKHTVRTVATWKNKTLVDKTFSVDVSVGQVVKSWDVALDKTKAKPGDTVNLIVTVNWGAPGSVQFKTKVTAFGRTFESQAVLATTSPFAFKVPLTVPSDASKGNYTIAVTLLVGV